MFSLFQPCKEYKEEEGEGDLRNIYSSKGGTTNSSSRVVVVAVRRRMRFFL